MKIKKIILSNKGFTLVELVAVIMVLSLILAVAVPRILHSIEESQREALRLTAKNIEKAARDRLQMSQDFERENKFFTIENGEFVGDSILLSGELPKNGKIYVRTDGEIGLAISDGKFCLIKNESDDEMIINKDIDNCELILETPAHCFYYYEISDDEVEIVYYRNFEDNCTSDVVIPKKIDNMTVASIGEGAFNNQHQIQCSEKNEQQQILAYNGVPNINKEDSLLISMYYECGDVIYHVREEKPITSLILPNTIKYIGPNAFRYNLLKDVTLPESVEYIGESAFLYNEIENIYIPSTVKEIGGGAFNDNLLPDNQAFIYAKNSDGSLDNTKLISYGGNKKEDINIPSSIKTIGKYAFSDCNFNKIVLSNNIESIEEYAFNNNSIINIEIPENVEIARNSISNTFYLSYVDYYEGLAGTYTSTCQNCIWKHSTSEAPSIPTSCFSYSYFAPSEVKITDYDSLCPRDVVIPSTLGGSNVVSISKEAFYKSKLVSVVLPNTLREINERAFYGNSLTSVVIPNSVVTLYDQTFAYNLLSNVTLPNNITHIGYATFAGNQLTSIIIPNSVTSIEGQAFQDNQLTTITLSNNVTYIGRGAFEQNQLTSVTIPNSVTTIEDSAFSSNQLTNISIPNSMTTIKRYSFAYNQINNLTIPSSVKTIESCAFESNQLTSLTIPSTVTTINYAAFNNNKLPDSQAFIYERNIDGTIDNTKVISYGGIKRNNVVIPNNVIEIGYEAFANNNLTSITIPNSVTTIGGFAFWFDNLTNIVIPNSVTNIGSNAFEYNQLTNLTLPSSLSTINSYVFSNNNLTNLIIPINITKIDHGAFRDNNLTSITIPSNVEILYVDGWKYSSISNSFYYSYVVNNNRAGGIYTAPSQQNTWTKQ